MYYIAQESAAIYSKTPKLHKGGYQLIHGNDAYIFVDRAEDPAIVKH